MKRTVILSGLLLFASWMFVCASSFAGFAGGGPKPGDVYKEYTYNMAQDEWRVTDPNADPVCNPGNCPSDYLPNPILNITVDDLENAVGAELVIDLWGGHDGTTNKRFRLNGNEWIQIPELDELGGSPVPGENYMQQVNHSIGVPLDHLTTGTNTLEGICGPNSWDWGQWGWYGVILRVYYNSAVKSHATGEITTPTTGTVFGDNPTISVSTTGTVDRVDVLAHYDGYDTDGDGIYADWHRGYHRTSWNNQIGIANHIGSSTVSPFEIQWDTTWVPDQPQNSIEVVARVRNDSGVWFVTDKVANLTLQRTDSSVKLYKPTGVPEVYWVRAGMEKSNLLNISTLSSAVEAKLLVRTWNGDDGTDLFYSKVNNWTAPEYGNNHFYSYDEITVPLWALKTGTNTLAFGSTTTHHGIEILWPGPAVAIRYDEVIGGPPIITTQPSNQSVVEGQTATFAVEAAGQAPLYWQWKKNGTDIPGATGASYTTPILSIADDSSSFSCEISNSDGNMTSDAAILYVWDGSNPDTLWEDFEGYATGQNPAGWFDTAADNSMIESPDLFYVHDLSGNSTFGTPSTAANIHSHYLPVNGGLQSSSYNFAGRMMMTSSDSGIGVTFFSDYASTDSYYRLRRYFGNSFHISPHGTSITGGTIDSGVVPQPNIWYHFKVQVEDTGTRTEIRAKVWQEGNQEPADWQIDCYDSSSSRRTTGTVGVWGFYSGSKYWDEFSVTPLSSTTTHTLSMLVSGNGSTIPAAGDHVFTEGSVVNISASPDAGWEFAGWTGSVADPNSPSTTVSMSADQTVTANFTGTTTYTLSMQVSGSGSTSPPVGDYVFTEGTVVSLSAVADSGWQFTGWTGSVADPSSVDTTVTMSADQTVTASFSEITNPSGIVSDDFDQVSLNTEVWTLKETLFDATVEVQGAGTGDAKLFFSVPSGVDHNAWVPDTAPRLLQAANDTDFELEVKFDSSVNSRFQDQGLVVHQSDDHFLRFDLVGTDDGSTMRLFSASLVSGTSSVKLSELIPLAAPIWLKVGRVNDTWTLSYSYNGTDWTESVSFVHAMTVTEAGIFVGNAGYGGNDAPAVTAEVDYFFNTAVPIVPEDGVLTRILSIQTNGNGSTTPAVGSYSFTDGTVVDISAVPDIDWQFDGWTGPVADTGASSTTVTMDADKSVTANFIDMSASTYDLTTSVSGGNGSIMPSGTTTYDAGSIVTLTATPDTGYRVASWSGTDDDSLTTSTNTVTMNTHKNVSVSFESLPTGENVVLNPDFESGTTSPWRFYTSGEGSFSLASPGYGGTGAAAHLDIVSPGTNMQLYQFNIPVEPYTDYRLSFAAYSNTGHDLRMSLVQHVSPYANYGLKNVWVNLTTGWQIHTIHFTTDNFSSSVTDARLMFWLASDAVAGDKYWIDNVVLAKTQTATQYLLTAGVVGGNGTVSPTSGTYVDGTVVTLSASPATGYRVVSWTNTDDDTLTTSTNTVTMTSDKEVTVEFEPIPSTEYDLTVNVGAGNGTVWPTSGTYPEGTVVSLSATPDTGWLFDFWTGDVTDPSSANTAVVMDSDQTVTAYFVEAPTYTLSMQVNGSGSTTPSVGDYVYAENTIVDISATPASGWQFTGWSGSVTDPSSPNTTVVMDWDQTVVANFAEIGDNTIYTEDFEAYANGYDPIEWLDTDAGNSMIENDALFQIFDLSGNKVFGTNSTLTNIHSHFVGTGAQTLSSYGYTGRMRISHERGGIGVTFLSHYPNEDAYYRLRRYGTGSFHVSPHGTAIAGGTTDTGVVPSPGVWYRFRIQVVDTGSQTQILARVWEDGIAEPSYWQVNAYDDSSARLTAGTFGVWSYMSGSKYWDDLTVTAISPDEEAPFIDVWYGSDQVFGNDVLGISQRWINILGNVSDPSGVASLTYTVNGGPEYPLTIGPTLTRLDEPGDFNAEILIVNLIDSQVGTNDVVIRAADIFGNETWVSVGATLIDNGTTWPASHTIEWTTSSIQDVAQVVDGLWAIEGGTVRPIQLGYDRLIAIGDMTWDNYEITVPLTVHSIEETYGPPYGGPTLGLIANWQGHTADGNQPSDQWWPVGVFGGYVWRESFERFQLLDNYYIVADTSGEKLTVGSTYWFKLRAETDASGSVYNFKAWQGNLEDEPSQWRLVKTEALSSDQTQGSVLLVAQFVDVTFGTVTIVPLAP